MRFWKIHEDESGQAISELMISLIGLMCVFLGLLMFTSLGIQNLQTLIHAREDADQNAYNGFLASSLTALAGWSYGNDGLLFTKDDSPIVANYDYAYRNELIATAKDANGNSLQFNPITDYPDYMYHNLAAADMIQDYEINVHAANLAKGTATVSNPLKERELDDLESAFGALMLGGKDFKGSVLSIQENVFMPLFNN